MQAMQLDRVAKIETHPLHLREVNKPKPGPRQLLMKVAACGVCRSNLHTIEGDWVANGVPAKSPIVAGHEVVGTVAELGEDVPEFKVGDRIGVQPLWWTDLTCEYCLTGREHLCPRKEITGETVDGGYAEYMLAHANHTYHLPGNLDFAEAAPLFCPGLTAYHAVRRAELAPGKTAALFGMGGVGHMVIQFARLAGADIIAVARGERHRKLAMKLGSIRAIEPKDAADLATTGGVDAAIVFAPSDEMFAQACAVVKPGGIIVNGAASNPGVLAFGEEKEVRGSVIGPRHHMNEVLRIASEGKLKVVVETFPLKDAEAALTRLKHGDIEARAVLVM